MKRLRRLLSRKTKSDSVSPPDSPDISKIDPSLRLNLDDNPKDEPYFVEESLLPCAVCGRTFAPLSLAKHVSICLKTVNKKRKQFDSLSQRVKGSPYDGTELQNYIPKNFESTPHTERERSKTPPASSRMASKSKAHNQQPTHSRLLATAEKTPCPHCGRSFGARALDRHVTFCAEQTRLARAPGASSGPDNVRVARERLMARTSYRAPLGRSKRSMTREKYSLSRSASEGSGMSDNSFDENRATRGRSEEYKHLPSITKTPLRASNGNGSLQSRNHKKTDPMVSKSSSKTVTPTYSRSKSLFDSNQAKSDKKYPEVRNTEYQFEEDIKQSLRELDKLCESNLSDTDSFGGFLSLKKRENYYNENHHYTNDADISQYLPKNLGLTDESPFLDKDNNLPKNRANESQDIRDKLLEAAKNICCPSCGHNFDIRAWVTEQVRLAKESQDPILNSTKRSNVMPPASRMNNYHHTPIRSTLY